MTAQALRLVEARALADHRGVLAAPGAVLLSFGVDNRSPGATVLAVGTPDEVARHEAAPGARGERLLDRVLVPGLVNAHTHLDLTLIGPRPHNPDTPGAFVQWLDEIRLSRPTEPEAIRAAVRRGVELSLAGGVVAVGDIAGAPRGRPCIEAAVALRDSSLSGVSFIELFGIGSGEAATLARVEFIAAEAVGAWASSGPVRLGLSPHAPTSCSLAIYDRIVSLAARHGFPLTTHLAESPDERRFITEGVGPHRRFLEQLGLWDDSVLADIGRGRSPVAYLARVLKRRPLLAAHVNDADDAGIEILARTGTAVAYCPRAAAYFDAPGQLGPHRYRDMLAAGITVALGTDSIVNLPAGAADPGAGGISVLDEMRLLHTRDGTDPAMLLAMATIHGAKALGLDESQFRFDAGRTIAGVVALEAPSGRGDPLADALRSTRPPLLLHA